MINFVLAESYIKYILEDRIECINIRLTGINDNRKTIMPAQRGGKNGELQPE